MRSLILNVLFYSITLTTALIALIAAQVGGRRTMQWFLKNYCALMVAVTRLVMNADIVIRGHERFKDKPPALLVGKHQSELDAYPVLAMFPNLAAIAMEELSRYPLIGPALKKLDYILVSVEGAKKAQLAQVMSGAKRVHAEGRPILIYPEGELMALGARERYRTGVWHIYDALGVEATPFAVSIGVIWPKREWTKYAHQRGTLEFMEPIAPGLDKETFMAELERRLEGRTMELIRADGPPERVAEAEKRHQLGLTNDPKGARRPPIPGLTDQIVEGATDGSAAAS